jgi:conjugative transfer region protein TrbK
MRTPDTLDIRQERGRTGWAILRFAIIACAVAIAIIAVGEALRNDVTDRAAASVTKANDPLAADLARCRDVTAEQLEADDTCRRVWAENRRRFFAPSTPAARPADTTPKTQDRAATSVTPGLSDEAR